MISFGPSGVEHAWRPLRALYGRAEDQIELVDKSRTRQSRIGLAFGELLTGDAANKPSVVGEFIVHPLEYLPGRLFRAPAAWERSTVDASHEANVVRLLVATACSNSRMAPTPNRLRANG
jgi:hypothetical protein